MRILYHLKILNSSHKTVHHLTKVKGYGIINYHLCRVIIVGVPEYVVALNLKLRSFDSFFDEKLSTKKDSTKKQYRITLNSFQVFTKIEYKKSLEQMIKELIKLEIEDIIDVLQSWVNQSKIELRNRKLRLSLLNNYFYYRGIKIDSRDLRDVDFNEEEPEERRGLSTEDLIRIIAATKNKTKRALYFSLATSGMAIGEACHIMKKDIDTSKDRILIHIQRSYTKRNGRGRDVFISKEAAKVLRSILEVKNDNDFVFHSHNDPEIAKENEMAKFRRLVDTLNLGDRYESGTRAITLHRLRAYFFTKATQKHGIAYAHKITGHKGYLEEYNNYSPEKKLEMYLELEPELFVFEAKPQPEELLKMKEKINYVYDILKKLDDYGESRSDEGITADEYNKMLKSLKPTQKKG